VSVEKSTARKWRTKQEGEGGCDEDVGEGPPMSVSIASTSTVFVSSSVMILCMREGPSVGSVKTTRLSKRKAA